MSEDTKNVFPFRKKSQIVKPAGAQQSHEAKNDELIAEIRAKQESQKRALEVYEHARRFLKEHAPEIQAEISGAIARKDSKLWILRPPEPLGKPRQDPEPEHVSVLTSLFQSKDYFAYHDAIHAAVVEWLKPFGRIPSLFTQGYSIAYLDFETKSPIPKDRF